ncbi:MAG: TlpA disulfide reductase family protein [Pirellulales bacterium]
MIHVVNAAGWLRPAGWGAALLTWTLGLGCVPAEGPPAPRGGSEGGGPRKTSATTGTPAPAESRTSSAAPPAETPPAETAPAETAPPPATPEASSAVKFRPEVQVATWKQTQDMIASHRGKIVVLDLWSNFCPPCLAELPHLGKLQQEFGEDVVCLALNCNYSGGGAPEDERAEVVKVITEIRAPFLTLISADKDEELYKLVGIASIPVVQVYGRDGQLARQFDNEKAEYGPDGFTYAQHIRPYVAELIKKPPADDAK